MATPEQLGIAYKKAIAAGDTEAADEIAKALNAAVESEPSAPPQQELVAGTPEQMAGQRARNLQSAMGLKEPVAPGESLGAIDRFSRGMAPTAEEYKAAMEVKYGEGSFVPISSNRALVRIPDDKGGKKWVVDNPAGLDVGDIAEFQANLPQFVAGTTAALATIPGPQSAAAKIAVASGASAAASGIVGGVQDLIWRFANNQPIQPAEIAQRRGMGAAGEFVAGALIPMAVGKVRMGFKAGSAIRNYFKDFIKEGKEAGEALRLAGVSPNTAGELADAIRNTSPATATASEMGDELAKIVSTQDEAMRKGATRLAGQALGGAEARAQAQIAASTQVPAITAPKAGLAAIGSAKQTLLDANDAATKLLNSALGDIQQAGIAAGEGKGIINLINTDKAIASLESSLLKVEKKVDGKAIEAPSDIYLPLLTTLRQIKQAADIPQELQAVRQARSMLGAKISGQSDLFPGLDVGVAKKIYKALSQDIDESVSRLTGPGAQKLRDYNKLYKSIVQPIEENEFLGKLVNDGFNNPEDVVKGLVNGGTADWAAAKSVLHPNVYASVRRAVVDEMVGGEKISMFGKDVANIPNLSRRLNGMSPEVKDEIFGSRAAWESLQRIGKEYDMLIERGGLFTKPALPTVTEISDAIGAARAQGFDKTNQAMIRAMNAAKARRNGMAESLLSQARNGNLDYITRNPEDFLKSVIFNDGLRPEYVRSIVKKLPEDSRKELGAVAFQEIFEGARNVAKSAVSRKQSVYNTDEIINRVFGSRKREEVIGDLVGPERMMLLRNWAKYEVMREAQAKQKEIGGKRIAGLIATAPYQNLFAARAASLALEKASGSRYLAGATPASSELFKEARLIINQPVKTRTQIAALQRILNTNGFQDYQEMMQGFTPEQQDAIDSYLTGQ